MQFLKKIFNHDNMIIGLSSLKKQEEYIKITIPEHYKKVSITNIEKNYILF